MIILGIDPGSRITGFGLIEKKGNQMIHLENGGISAPDTHPFDHRLKLIFNGIQKIIHDFEPEQVAIESIFYSKNVQSALKLGHARGVALVAASLSGISIYEYTPLAIKQAVVGYGGASKDQVQKMVQVLLKLPQVAEENASDALAVAICHAHSLKMNKILAL